jgi:hypothetical protein
LAVVFLAVVFLAALAVVFLAAAFLAGAFLAAVFLAAAAFLAGAFLAAAFLRPFVDGPASRRACNSSDARRGVMPSTVSPSRSRSEALVSPSVT